MVTSHFVTDTGTVDRPDDVTGVSFASSVPTTRGFDFRDGEGAADGTFVVPVVPGATEWYLGIQPPRTTLDLVVGNATRLDLGHVVLGRPDARPPTTTTIATVNATGLAPLGFGVEEIAILSTNAGALRFLESTELPASGATAITGAAIEWRESLIDTARGDTARMLQFVVQPASPGSALYVALAKASPPTSVTMVDGAPSSMSFALADVSRSRTLTVHVKGSQLEALRDQVGPAALPSTVLAGLDIVTLPQVAQRGFAPRIPKLVRFFPPDRTADYDQTFRYGNPLTIGGVAASEYVVVRHTFRLQIPGGSPTDPVHELVGYDATIPVGTVAADGTIAPAITPVRNVKIDGRDLGAPASGVGNTPTLTWDPPAIGTPTGYVVGVKEIIPGITGTAAGTVARLHTSSTSVRLPTYLMSPRWSYFVEIRADIIPGYDPTAPFATATQARSQASMLTAQFTL